MNNIPSDSAQWVKDIPHGPTLEQEGLSGGYLRPREAARRQTMDGLMGREDPKTYLLSSNGGEANPTPGLMTDEPPVMGEATDRIWPMRRVGDSKGLKGKSRWLG